MKAIKVKFLAPTTYKGSRLKASDMSGNSVTISTDYAINSDENSHKAAITLCKKMDWPTDLLGGSLDNDTDVYVFNIKKEN